MTGILLRYIGPRVMQLYDDANGRHLSLQPGEATIISDALSVDLLRGAPDDWQTIATAQQVQAAESADNVIRSEAR